MYTTSGTIAALGLALSASLLAGCGTSAQPVENTGSEVQRTPDEVEEAREKRFREQFWGDQHIHDSWNKCHIGENVPKRHQRGEDCWSRLRPQTGR